MPSIDSEEFVYRVTYLDGHTGATCSRRSLAGKIGYSNENVRRNKRHGHHIYRSDVIVKIERAPLHVWEDVTTLFPRLEGLSDNGQPEAGATWGQDIWGTGQPGLW